jgi:hypothetical protein
MIELIRTLFTGCYKIFRQKPYSEYTDLKFSTVMFMSYPLWLNVAAIWLAVFGVPHSLVGLMISFIATPCFMLLFFYVKPEQFEYLVTSKRPANVLAFWGYFIGSHALFMYLFFPA